LLAGLLKGLFLVECRTLCLSHSFPSWHRLSYTLTPARPTTAWQNKGTTEAPAPGAGKSESATSPPPEASSATAPARTAAAAAAGKEDGGGAAPAVPAAAAPAAAQGADAVDTVLMDALGNARGESRQSWILSVH